MEELFCRRFLHARRKAASAAGLVFLCSTNQYTAGFRRYALISIGGIPADHANGEVFRDVFGHGQELRNRIEGEAAVIPPIEINTS